MAGTLEYEEKYLSTTIKCHERHQCKNNIYKLITRGVAYVILLATPTFKPFSVL